jgi:DNA-3-methyladenine glycosylase II
VKPEYWDDATRALGRADPVMKRLIRSFPDIHLARRADPFTTLARAIVGQQISVKAAQTIWERFVVATVVTRGSNPRGVTAPAANALLRPVDPGRVSRMRMPTLRRCGLSQRKAEYLRDLAAHFVSGRLDPRRWTVLADEELIAALTDVKGIGRWTAEMFLIFHELRADVLPVDDIGLQRAIALHYNKDERLPHAAIRDLATRWQPYRSVATWYLWRALDPVPVEY